MKGLILGSLLLAPVLSWACSISQITISNASVRAVPPEQKTTAAYLVMKNTCDQPMDLIKVSSSAADKLELHETTTEKGVAKMSHLESITLAPNEETKLAPGAKHIMMIGLTHSLKPGSSIPLTLHFKDGSSKTIAVKVEDMRG